MLNCEENIKGYNALLLKLLAATSIKYSSWPTQDKSLLKKSAGIYHFFEKRDDVIDSLYVGKAGFGDGNWSLHKRLQQHFRPSQKNTLLGKAAIALEMSASEVKEKFVGDEVYLQWLPLCIDVSKNSDEISSELIWFECFCKAILKPRYTDA